MPRAYALRSGITLRDIVVLMLALLLLATALLTLIPRQREYAYMVKCASNLRQIGQGLLLYASQNRQHWPRTRYEPGTPPTWFTGATATDPFAADGPAANDVSAALWLLVRTQQIEPDWFRCPNHRGNWPTGLDPMRLSNFPRPDLLHYSVANPYPDTAATQAGYRWNANQNPEFAVAADMNPGGRATAATHGAGIRSRAANSRNHDLQFGFNVLFGDGHVETVREPTVGVERDNIFTFGRTTLTSGGSGVTGSPTHADDSVLLPAATFDGGAPTHPSVRREQIARAIGMTWWTVFAGTVGALYLFVCSRGYVGRAWRWTLDHICPSRRRTARGLCSRCGYDLRASPSGCPECGLGRS